jgi:hypothetical protein
MANKYRGEVLLRLENEVYTLRPTFQALCEIETGLGRSIVHFLTHIDERGVLLAEQVLILAAGIRGAGGGGPKNLPELIMAAGAAQILPVIFNFLEEGVKL